MDRLYEIPKQLDIIIVNPIIHTYTKCSNYITKLALQYVAPEDFHPYIIEEFFMDMTSSLHLFAANPYEFAQKLQLEIYTRTRIDCTIGIGPNLLMSKVGSGAKFNIYKFSKEFIMLKLDFSPYKELQKLVYKEKCK